jgi:predicted porin
VSTSALAQSSVSIYGVVDASLENVKGTDSLTRVSSDNLATSRLGFRGVEDLGGGLKAKFTLEAGLKVDTGAQDSAFWGRSAWVGLEGGFGELRVGRQDSLIGAIAGNTNILGAQGYDDLKIADTLSGSTYRRVNNGITYFLPKLVDGLSIAAQYSTDAVGEENTVTTGTGTSTDKTGQAWGLSAQYLAGPFGIGGGFITAKQDAAGDNKAQGYLLFASYDFGAAKLTGYFESDDSEAAENNPLTAATYDKRDVFGLKVGVPLGTDFSLQAGISKVKNVAYTQDQDATIIALKGVYTLSKRTAVYGLFTNVDNDKGNLGVAGVATAADKNSRGFAIGVRHAF